MPTTRSILVVDDDALLCRIRARMLEEAGYRVVTAGNGDEALAVLREHGSVVLVVTDVRMPRMDGVALASHLARLDPPPQVLFVSGYGLPGPMPGPFLTKPFTPKAFVDQVRRMIGDPDATGLPGAQPSAE